MHVGSWIKILLWRAGNVLIAPGQLKRSVLEISSIRKHLNILVNYKSVFTGRAGA